MAKQVNILTNNKSQIATLLNIAAITIFLLALPSIKTHLITDINQQLNRHTTTVQVIKPSVETSIVKDWKSYTDSYHKFSFQYPRSWNIKVESSKHGNNVILLDESNMQRISFIGISNSAPCDQSRVKLTKFEKKQITIGNVVRVSTNLCWKDKYTTGFTDVNNKIVLISLSFFDSPAEVISREILKSVDNLRIASVPID